MIVVGGGPAGGMAAWTLAPHCRVLVLERARLPREKLCSGVVTAKTATLLGGAVPIDTCLIGSAAAVLVTHRGRGRPMAIAQPLLFVSRPRMDAALLEAAARRGAEVAEGEAVAAVDPDGASVTLASGRVLRARVVVGADGAAGVSARAAGTTPRPGVAVEARVPDPRGSGDRAALIEAALPGGYLWAFPKFDGTVAIGGGTLDPAVRPHLHARVAAWAHAAVGAEVPARVPGHLLPFRPVRRPWRGRLLLAGDAAGLIDPLLGEGIPYALWSGRLAGAQVLAWLEGRARLSDYPSVMARLLAWRWPYALLALRADAVRRLMAIPPVTRVGWRWLVDRAPAV